MSDNVDGAPGAAFERGAPVLASGCGQRFRTDVAIDGDAKSDLQQAGRGLHAHVDGGVDVKERDGSREFRAAASEPVAVEIDAARGSSGMRRNSAFKVAMVSAVTSRFVSRANSASVMPLLVAPPGTKGSARSSRLRE